MECVKLAFHSGGVMRGVEGACTNKGAEVWHGSKASLDEYAHGRHGGGVPRIEAKS